MKQPRISDDGTSVTIDLHGVWVDRAMDAVEQLIKVAAERGRRTLRVIHGSSTSVADSQARTIKHALHDSLDHGDFPEVASDFRQEDITVLNIVAASNNDKRRITLFNLR